MKNTFAMFLGLGLALQSHALLIEEFKNNQIDFVPGPSGGKAPNTKNGYLYPYANTGSAVYKGGTAVELTATLLANATTYESPNGLAFDLALGGTTTDKYAGVGFQFLKPGGSTVVPIYYPVDLSDYSSVIVSYQSTRPLVLEWMQSDTEADGAEFFCQLPTKATEGTHTCLLSLQTDSTLGFKQPYWVSEPTKIKTFDKSTAIGLKFAIKSGVAGAFVLKGVYLDNTDQEWPVVSSSSIEISSSSVIPLSSIIPASSTVLPSSSSVVLPSSSSINPKDLVWQPSLINQIEFNGIGGGYWYGYASKSPVGSYTPDDFSTLTGPIISVLNNGGASGFAAIGFDWKDNGEVTPKGVANLSSKSSLCISYTSSKEINVAFKQQNISDVCPQYILKLPAAPTATTAELLLSGLKREGVWGATTCNLPLSLIAQTGVHFQNKTTPAATITISKIGFNGYCGTPSVIVGLPSSSSTPPSSVARSSSGNSSTKPSSSSAVIIPNSSSSSAIPAACLTILNGYTKIWMLEDDNLNGVPNYMEPKHLCYQGTGSVLGVHPDMEFGFVKLNGREITFRTSNSGLAKLEVFSSNGRLISNVFQGYAPQGIHTTTWNGDNLPGGVYHFRLTQGKQVRLIRAVLVH